VRGIVRVAFEAYRHDPRGVKVLILEVGRSPSGGAVNRGTAFAGIIQLASAMFEDAQKRGEFPSTHNPTLAAISLFGAIEMGLTAFVLGLIDRKSDAELDRARDQVASSFLHGIVPPSARAESSTWTPLKSATKSKATKAS
jgi:TetR/AcrR family fatty acid metabolism transcriptional regulator